MCDTREAFRSSRGGLTHTQQRLDTGPCFRVGGGARPNDHRAAGIPSIQVSVLLSGWPDPFMHVPFPPTAPSSEEDAEDDEDV